MAEDRMQMGSRCWARVAGRRLNRRHALGAALAGSGAASLLAACGGGQRASSGSASNQPSASSQKPHSGGSVNVWQPVDPFDFDVTYLGKNTNNVEGIQHAYSQLIRFKFGTGVKYNDLALEPALADKWETPDDQTYLISGFREGAGAARL